MTAGRVPIYLEIGSKRVFAGALEWPGWSRGGRTESAAVEALATYGPRYGRALAASGAGIPSPAGAGAFEVVERLAGGSSTDFGAPGSTPDFDRAPLDGGEAARQLRLLEAAWAAFDRSVATAIGRPLATGPRGGGRALDAIVRHVLEAEQAYLAALGGRSGTATAASIDEAMAGTRAAVERTLFARVRGEPLPPTRRTSPLWTPRYFVRRSAWHALDHAWEVEDRVSRR
jgi:hypothetical protein